MSDSLGRFSIDLEAKIANFVSDMGRAAREAEKQMRAIHASVEQGVKKIEEAGRRAGEGVREAITAVTGWSTAQLGVGVLVAGLGHVTKSALETADKIDNLSQRAGIGADALSGFAHAAVFSDISFEGLGAGLTKFNRTVSEAAGGGKEQAAAFKAIGVSVTDAAGKLKATDAIVLEVAERFAGFRDDANKTALAMALFGKSGAELIPFLNHGREGLTALSIEAKELGIDFGAIAAKSAEFKDGADRIGQAVVGIGVDIAKELLPPLIAAEAKVLDFVKSLRADGTLQSFAAGVANLALNLDKLAIVLGTKWAVGAVAGIFDSLAAATEKSAARMSAALATIGASLSLVTAAVAGWQFGSYLEQHFLQAKLAGIALVDGVLTLWEELKRRTSLAWAVVVTVIQTSLGVIQGGIGASLESLSKAASLAFQDDLAARLHGLAQGYVDAASSVKSYGDRSAEINAEAEKNIAGIHTITSSMADDAIAAAKAASAHRASGDAAKAHGEQAKQAAPNVTALAKAMGEDAAKAAAKLAELLNKDGEILAGIQARLNPAQKLYSDYAKSVAEANTVYQKALDLAEKSGASFETIARIKAHYTAKIESAQQALNAETAEFKKQHDVVTQYLDTLRDDSALVGLTDRQKDITKAVQDLTRAWGKDQAAVQAWARQQGVLDPTLANVQQLIAEATEALYDHKEAVEASKAAARDWQAIWSRAGDGFAEAMGRGGSLLKHLTDLAQQTVQQIIATFAKLSLINPILNSVFCGSVGFSMLPTLANALGGSGAIALAQTGAQVAGMANGGAASASTDVSWSSPSTWLSAGKALFSGFSNGFSSLWSGNTFNPASTNFVGPPVQGQAFGPQLGGYASGLQQILGVLGGVAAGVNRLQNADGAFGKLGGGLSYGLGTYALGAGISSAIAGTGFAAGVTGAFSAIPIAGWIALGTMLLDKFSGGNVFGTGWNKNGETKTQWSVGAAGVSVANFAEEKKKHALFGGNEYRWMSAGASSEQTDLAKQLSATLDKARASASTVLGAQIAGIVIGAFQERWNKDGKVTEQISTVLGKTYIEPIEDFVKRLQAENVLAQIDAARNDSAATQVADAYRKNADTLSQAAQMLLQAQVDIRHGQSLLGGGNESLKDIDALVHALSQDGETMVQTYQRLQAETQTLQSTLDGMGLSIGKSGVEFVKFADAASSAAGGVDKLQSLLGAFQSAYYGADEIANAQIAAFQKQAQGALAALGLDVATAMPDLRKVIEAKLPSATPEELVSLLNAANLLAQATAAQKHYNDTLTQNASNIQSILGQLNPAGDPKAGTWQATLEAIHRQFDDAIAKLKSYGATADQIAQAEADRATTIIKTQQAARDAYADVVKQLADGMETLNGGGQTDVASQVAAIRQAEQDTIDQLNAAAKAAGMQAASEKDLALAHQYANAQVTQLARSTLDSRGFFTSGASEFATSIVHIQQQARAAEDAFDALAKTQGKAGASAADLARVELWAAEQTAQAISTLQARTQDLISQLYGGKAGTLEEVNRHIAELEAATRSLGDSASNAASSIEAAANAMRAQIQLQIGELSPYNDNQKLDIAKQAYLSGNANAEDVLNIARRLYASTNDYKQVFDWVMANHRAVASPGAGGDGGVGGGMDRSADLAALYKQRDELLAQQVAEQRKALATELIQSIADLAKQNHIDALAQLYILGVQLPQVVQDLGIDLKAIGEKDVFALAQVADTLGVGLGSLLGKLGMGFGDLTDGLKQITDRMGIDLGRIDATNLQKLADLAGTLHIGMGDLLAGLHLSLADLSLGLEQMVAKLGIDLTSLNDDGVKALAKLAGELHLSLGEVVGALHLNLTDLSEGLRALAKQQSIDLAHVDANGVAALSKLAGSLNLSLSDLLAGLNLNLKDVAPGLRNLTTALGIDLSNLSAGNVTELGKLAGSLNTNLASLTGALGLSLKDIAPGLTKIATDLGLNLAALTQADATRLAELANAMHLRLTDLASALHLSVDAVSAAINANTQRVSTEIASMTSARLGGDHDIALRLDGFTRTVTDLREQQVAALRSVDTNIAQLPEAIRSARTAPTNDELLAELRRVRAEIGRTAGASEFYMQRISVNTDNTASNTADTALNTRNTANSLRGSLVPQDRNVRT